MPLVGYLKLQFPTMHFHFQNSRTLELQIPVPGAELRSCLPTHALTMSIGPVFWLLLSIKFVVELISRSNNSLRRAVRCKNRRNNRTQPPSRYAGTELLKTFPGTRRFFGGVGGRSALPLASWRHVSLGALKEPPPARL